MAQQQSNGIVYRHEELYRILNRLNETQAELACELRKTLSFPSDGCSVDFDTVLCWPQTSPNTIAVLPCLEQLNGIKYDIKGKEAFLNGISRYLNLQFIIFCDKSRQ